LQADNDSIAAREQYQWCFRWPFGQTVVVWV